ncbi:MAG: hypothetical protein LBE17_02585 [Treponema sp.]|jgi:hypothetical protein|nr:hypothetical protein [Treponema sp.]
MMKRRLPALAGFGSPLIPVCLFILFFTRGGAALSAVEFLNGRIKLVLHEDTGRFSLYYLIDMPQQRDIHLWRYEPFFVDSDPRTSFLTVMANDRTYRLGESTSFRVRIRPSPGNPAILFESPFLAVTQEFTFIKTIDAPLSNGVRMTIRLENRGTDEVSAGARFLLDTNLGEGSHGDPFSIGEQPVSAEFMIDSPTDDPCWISRTARYGLMGSVSTGEGPKPDQIHFANWQRLNEVPWKLGFISGRNFNYLPYSINDSAVAYTFDPRPLAAGESRDYVILLAMVDERGFFQTEDAPAETPPINDSREEDLITLRDFIARLDNHLAGRLVLSDEELAEIEAAITSLKSRYLVW